MTDKIAQVTEPVYFRKPEQVKMFQWTGDIDQEDDPVWIVEAMRNGCAWHGNGGFWVADNEDRHWEARPGDYIVLKDEDDLWVVKQEDFDKWYMKGEPKAQSSHVMTATEREGIRAAMAKEASNAAVDWYGPYAVPEHAENLRSVILALAPLPAGHVCVPAQREFICKSCFLRSEEGKPEGDAPF